MPWLQVHITTGKANAGRAEALLETLGALSITIEDAADQPLLEPGPGETPLWESARITGLFDASLDPDGLRSAVALGMTDTAIRVAVEALDDQPWERAWLDHFRPMRFGRRLWVCPRGQALPGTARGAVVLRLDPGLAFGTGSHATTALCLEWLDNADLAGSRLIDYGCGSGILAIASAMLGAASVLAVDHDPQALLATRENAAANGVVDKIVVSDSRDLVTEAADIVLANILATTLIELADPVGSLVRKGGQLVLSGILEEQADGVVAAYGRDFDFSPPVCREGWVLLAAARRTPRDRD